MHNDEMHVTSERLLKQSSMSTLYCDGIDDTSSGGAPAETLVDVRADFGMGDSGGHDAQVSHMLPVDRVANTGMAQRRCLCGQVASMDAASQMPGWKVRREVSIQCNLLPLPPPPLMFAESSCMLSSQREPHFYARRTVDLTRGGVKRKRRSATFSTAGSTDLLFCHLCPFTTISKHSLKSHMLIHTGERRFECTVCSQKFALKGTLKRHMRTHTGEKPYKCEVCPYEAADSSSLTLHMANHTGHKEFACGVCPYVTSRNCDIRKHLRIHTGDRPYKCDKCSYAAAIQSTLNRHIRSKHAKESSKEMSHALLVKVRERDSGEMALKV
ncbi:zinc finger protein 879 isoform X3 [Rhipicephalus sanguineus]|uniref:zinc finger protein 879 isoform X3 n=1 Tax=Rhipicephalus sanguineus TaxID=34632 RepID=UPI0018930620|nr:zinc finger protein 879 isoform X3 [Rhipicephalus sanguineus]